jgi:hypothetical protein
MLKLELVHHRHYRTWYEAIREIVEYIEIFYNRQKSMRSWVKFRRRSLKENSMITTGSLNTHMVSTIGNLSQKR